MDSYEIKDEDAKLHWADYLILGLALLLSASVGIFYAYR